MLGTGDSMGVPRIYCDCGVCGEARQSGSNRRFRSSALVESGPHRFLLDCGPDWLQQMENLNLRALEHVLVTHAHHDHIAGLPEWADACRWTGKTGHVYAPSDVLQTINRQYPWLERHLRFHSIYSYQSFFGWELTAWKVNHGKNGYSYAYKFEKAGYHWVYCPDSIALNEAEQAPMRGVQLLILGTSYYKEEYETAGRSVYDMVEALELVEQLQVEQAVFTHMSHGIDANRGYPLPGHVCIGIQGEIIPLGF